MNRKRYVIVNSDLVTDEMIEHSCVVSRDTMRVSLDGTKAILSFGEHCDIPMELDGLGIYTHEEMLEHVSGNLLWEQSEESAREEELAPQGFFSRLMSFFR